MHVVSNWCFQKDDNSVRKLPLRKYGVSEVVHYSVTRKNSNSQKHKYFVFMVLSWKLYGTLLLTSVARPVACSFP